MHPSEKNFLCAEIFPEPPSLTEVRPQKRRDCQQTRDEFFNSPSPKMRAAIHAVRRFL